MNFFPSTSFLVLLSFGKKTFSSPFFSFFFFLSHKQLYSDLPAHFNWLDFESIVPFLFLHAVLYIFIFFIIFAKIVECAFHIFCYSSMFNLQSEECGSGNVCGYHKPSSFRVHTPSKRCREWVAYRQLVGQRKGCGSGHNKLLGHFDWINNVQCYGIYWTMELELELIN